MGALLQILRGQVGTGVPLDLLGPSQARLAKRMSKGASYASGRNRRPITLGQSEAGYSASAVAYRCVHYIATNLSSVDLVVLQGDEANDEHEVAVLWNRHPNDLVSARTLKEIAYARLELIGEQLIYLDRGPTGEGAIQGAYPIFDPVEVVVDQRLAGQLKGFVVKTGQGRVPLLPSEVLWLRYPHPFEEWGALAPWKAALYAAESDAYARAWQRGEFQHGARPSSVVYLGDLDEDAHEAAVAEFKAEVEGPENAGKSLLVSGPTQARLDRLTLTPAEMSYLESRVANADEVMLAFGLRPDLFRGQATYENQRAAKVAAWSDTLLPKLQVLASETDRQLLPDLAETAAFDVSAVDALRENADALWTRVGAAVEGNLLWLDEGRAELGYDPLPGGRGQQLLAEFQATVGGGLGPAAGRDAGTLQVVNRPVVRMLVTAGGLRTDVRKQGRCSRCGKFGTLSASDTQLCIPCAKKLRLALPAGPQLVRAKGRTVAAVLRFYERHERIGVRAVTRLAEKQERIVVRRLRDLVRREPDVAGRWQLLADAQRISTSPWTELPVASGLAGGVRVAADDIFDVAHWREQTQEYLQAFMAGVWEGGAADAAGLLGLSLDLFDLAVIEAMRTRTEVLADVVTKTTRQVLDAQLLQAGVEGGESIDQLTARVRAVFADLQGWRATAIARTETVGGFNAASRKGALASGVVTGRVWLSSHDDRVRETHKQMDGERLDGLAGAYSNGLLHPGDPSGPPKETVNCRCVETYEVAP